jgi:hypothetical protein
MFDEEFALDWDNGWPDLWQPDQMKYLVIGKEICPDTLNRHYQCYVQLKTKRTLSWLKANVHETAHFERAKGTPEQNRTYCTKENNFREWGAIVKIGARQDIELVVDRIKNGEKVDDLMFDPECAGTISRCLVFFRNVEANVVRTSGKAALTERMSTAILRPWQAQVANLVDESPDTRKVFWYYDEIGNTGKSFLVDWLVSLKNAVVFTNGKMADISYAYKNEPIVIFDLARCQADKIDNVYMAVENFKNGRIFSPKYESQTKVFPVPHVFVFANFEPDRNKLSHDRWHVTRVLG